MTILGNKLIQCQRTQSCQLVTSGKVSGKLLAPGCAVTRPKAASLAEPLVLLAPAGINK